MLPNLDQALQVIQRGDRCRDLLANDSFAWVVDDMTHYHLSALVAAPPGPRGEDAVRYHHALQNALSEICATLKGYAEAGEAMTRALEQGDEEEDL